MAKGVKEFFAKSGDYVKDLNLNAKENSKSILSKLSLSKKPDLRNYDKDLFELALDKFSIRRSCRSFLNKEIELKVVYDIIDCALKSPCAGGVENVFVIIIEDEKKRQKLATIHSNQNWAGEAPIMLAVVYDESKLKDLFPDNYQTLAAQNATLVSGSIINLISLTNLSTCMVNSGDNLETCKALGIDPSFKVDCLLPIGYQFQKPGVFTRHQTGEKVFFEKFGNHDRGGPAHH